MDKGKIELAMSIADQAVQELEDALDRNDQRATGAYLYILKRELSTLRKLVAPPSAEGGDET